MSTISGFFIGVLGAAALTTFYADRLVQSLPDRVVAGAVGIPVTVPIVANVPEPAGDDIAHPARQLPPVAAVKVPLLDSEAGGTVADSRPELARRWGEFSRRSDKLSAVGEFPWRSCFSRAAASYQLPESLLLAIASGESNFDPLARSGKDAVGLMQIRWPGTARHLGVLREADLYDPCTNVDAGARYLAELVERYESDLHLAIAAYNFGPGRVEVGKVPQGALWYSQYIYQHLQQVLGEQAVPALRETVHKPAPQMSTQLLMRFSGNHRARDFIEFLTERVPGINLRQQNRVLGQFDVVLLYSDETERRRMLGALDEAGVIPPDSPAITKLSL